MGDLVKNKEVKEALGGLAGNIGLDPTKMAGKLFPARMDKSSKPASGGKPSYGIDNIKSFAFPSATAMQVGVARSPTSSDPEVTVEMAFRNYDWRVTKIIPNLLER